MAIHTLAARRFSNKINHDIQILVGGIQVWLVNHYSVRVGSHIVDRVADIVAAHTRTALSDSRIDLVNPDRIAVNVNPVRHDIHTAVEASVDVCDIQRPGTVLPVDTTELEGCVFGEFIEAFREIGELRGGRAEIVCRAERKLNQRDEQVINQHGQVTHRDKTILTQIHISILITEQRSKAYE